MKILKKIRTRFQYPLDMEDKIIQHEEKMLKILLEIINEKYQPFFHKHGCTLKIALQWGYMCKNLGSDSRLQVRWDYSCSICCEVHKNGRLLEVDLHDGEVDYYPMWAIWEISIINFCFCRPPYLLIKDIDCIYEDMDELVEMLNEAEMWF